MAKSKKKAVSAGEFATSGASNTGDTFALGQVVINPALKSASIVEVLESADLNFQTEVKPMRYQNHKGEYVDAPDTFAVIRTDTGHMLGDVGKRYETVSYSDALREVFGAIVDNGGIPTRALGFRNGAAGSIQFTLPESYWVGASEQKSLVTLATSHDGTMGIKVGLTMITIVCGNTFARAMRDLGYSFKHTLNVRGKLSKVAEMMGIMRQESAEYVETLNRLDESLVDSPAVEAFTRLLFPVTSLNKDGSPNKASLKKREVLQGAINTSMLETGIEVPSLYTLFSGVTRMVDHTLARQGDKKANDSALQWEYANEGSGHALKTEAWELLAIPVSDWPQRVSELQFPTL